MNDFKPLLKLSLQHFAEGVQPPQQTEPQVTPQPTPTPQNQPQLNINDLVSNISNKINETLNQRLSPIEQRMNQPTAEQIEAQNESIRQQFETNPSEFIKNIQQQAKEQAMTEFQAKYDPIIKKTEQLGNKLSWQDQVRRFTASNPEATKHMTEITQVLQENPELMATKNPLDKAYKLAMSNNLMGSNGNIIENILGNEDYKAQIMQNPQLREAIIQEYQNGLNNGTAQVIPPMMGNQGGTSIPASTGSQPNNLKEAKQAALRRFQQMNQ